MYTVLPYFIPSLDVFDEVHIMWLPNFLYVLNLVTDRDDRFYQMLLCDKNAEIQAEHSSTLCRKETENKMLFKLEAPFLPR